MEQNAELLEAAVLGYRAQLAGIDLKIQQLKRQLNRTPAATAAKTTKTHHRISPEGRARIAAAQRKRWAATKKARKTAAAGA